MGHSIPVFLLPIAYDEAPIQMEHWDNAGQLLSQKYEKRDENRLYCITSRNWWVQHAISLICTDLGIMGLEFITREIVCITIGELQTVKKAFGKLISIIANGIPKLSPDSEAEGSIWGLRRGFDSGKEILYTDQDIRNAYTKASIVPDLYVADAGYQSVIDFFSSVRIYEEIINYCIQNNKCLLIVHPQP
jgi:hypothetical protein